MSKMKRTLFLSVFILLSGASIHAQQKQPVVADNPESGTWINVAPAKAGFTVLMPGQASESANELKNGLKHHLITLETKLAGYVVTYVEFPDEVTEPAAIKDMLDRGREGGIASSKAELMSEKEIKLNQFFGREWSLKLPKGLLATSRAYWVKRRLYQTVFVITPNANDSLDLIKLRQEAGTKFLNSFGLRGDDVPR
jgi:hypothetical protein